MNILKSLFLYLSLILIFTTGCSTTSFNENEYGIQFEQIQKLPLGATTEYVKSQFGNPDKIEAEPSMNQIDRWVYHVKDKSWSRAILLINNENHQLVGKAFHFYNDPEGKYEQFITQFKDIHFTSQRGKQIGHNISDEIYFSSEENGIFFVLNEGRNEIQRVTWMLPSNSSDIKNTIAK